jgi:hypothetical protein
MSRPARGRLAAVAAALVLAAAAAGAAPAAKPASPPPAAQGDSLRFVAYYFHGNVRCATCRKLEQYSRDAVAEGFPRELATDRLRWLTVNVDKKENAHFTKDFGLYTRSLVLVAERGGKTVRWKNLERIWELVRDPGAFEKYVQGELRAFMKDPA